jgi:hypothetical protein
MLAPAPGDGSSTLLLTPDHLGSTVPLLLVWLVVDRCRPRWYVPVAAGILLAWGLVADPLLEVTGVAPLVLVCAIRAAQRLHPKEPRDPQDPGNSRRPASAVSGHEHLRLAGPARWSAIAVRTERVAVAADSGWGFARQWYTPAGHDADFVVTDAAPGTATWHSSLKSARNTFGPPARIYSYRQYTVLVWSKNLLTRLG